MGMDDQKPHDIFVQRNIRVVIYVDGSYMSSTYVPKTPPKTPLPTCDRGGSGVVFADEELAYLNLWIPVPLPALLLPTLSPPLWLEKKETKNQNTTTLPLSLPYDSMRAELYASLCAIYSVHMRKQGLFSPATLYLIKQDCIGAIFLLRWSYAQPKAPSRMLKENQAEMDQLALNIPWGGELGKQDIFNYQDILDMWWFWSRGTRVELVWVPAHADSASDFATKATKVNFSYSAAHSDDDLEGNRDADILAKSACSALALQQCTKLFSSFPLYNIYPSLIDALHCYTAKTKFNPIHFLESSLHTITDPQSLSIAITQSAPVCASSDHLQDRRRLQQDIWISPKEHGSTDSGLLRRPAAIQEHPQQSPVTHKILTLLKRSEGSGYSLPEQKTKKQKLLVRLKPLAQPHYHHIDSISSY